MNQFTHQNARQFLFGLDNANFLGVFDEYCDGVLITTANGIIVYYNKAMSRIDELEPEDAILNQVTDVYDLTHETSLIMRCLSTRQPIIDNPIYYRTRRGKFANTIHNVHPIFNRNQLVGCICFVRDFHVLTETLSTLRMPEIQHRMQQYEITFDSIVGQDPAFKDALNAARMAANTPSPVMLYGETGTGKELFARAIHNHSPRHEKKYTPVNCAAIPENLLEGILFGTSKGAFTGAINKAGLFERTSQGTIFLDEINSMPVGLQSKILRIIQEGKVRRVGALKEIKFDLKIISSVNQDPHVSIADGSLRSDLFYRLGVVFIHIVPLRERMTDLPLLVDHFIDKHNKSLGRQVRGVEDGVMERFYEYHWPGNVRELEHAIEGAMNIMGPDNRIRIKYLQPHFRHAYRNRRSAGQRGSLWMSNSPVSHDTLETGSSDLLFNKKEHEKKMVWQALMQFRGNVTRSARKLGISRQLLYYKMKKFNLSRDQFR